MYLTLEIKNKFLVLLDIKGTIDKNLQKDMQAQWNNMMNIIASSNFQGKHKLKMSAAIDSSVIAKEAPVKLQEHFYADVFVLLEEFLKSKIYFYEVYLEDPVIKKQLRKEYLQNKKNLQLIVQAKKEMRHG